MLDLFIQDFASKKALLFSVTDKEEDLCYYHSLVITPSKDYKFWETKNPLIDWIDRIFCVYVCS